jgi:hypothetical protein
MDNYLSAKLQHVYLIWHFRQEVLAACASSEASKQVAIREPHDANMIGARHSIN